MQPLTSDICRAIAEYWSERRGGRAMPPRGAIDPLTIPRLALPHVFLVEIIRDAGAEPRFVYRIVGTAINAMTGRDITGQEISARTYGPIVETVLEPFRRVAASAAPLGARTRAVRGDTVFESESVFLPLGDGVQPSHVLGAVARLDESRLAFAKHESAEAAMTLFELAG